jgi:hypothetical protein
MLDVTMEELQHSLDLDEHLSTQRLGLWVSRSAWAAMAAVLVAALLGYLGGGPLSHRSARHPSGIALDYDGFGRYGADSILSFEIPAGAAGGDTRSLWIDGDYLQSMKIDQITPEPDKVVQSSGGYRYMFLVSQQAPDLEVTFDLTAAEVGGLTGAFSDRMATGATTFDQFLFP